MPRSQVSAPVNATPPVTMVGYGRRQQADRPDACNGDDLDCREEKLGVRWAADQKVRGGMLRVGGVAHPRIAKISTSEAQGAQEKHLQEPVKNDGEFAQK